MKKNKLLLLGIPIDVMSTSSLKEKIEELLSDYKKDHQPRFATTINSYFLSHIYSWSLQTPYNPELLRVLQNSDLITVNSSFLLRLCNWFGENINTTPLQNELLDSILRYAWQKDLSIYLLGGNEKITNLALEKSGIKVKIVGQATPLILTKGERIAESLERDELIFEAINNAQPDLLILQLGHPKEEIWFNRIKNRLSVPLTIGVGGAFERYVVDRPNIPNWASQLKIEKAYLSFLKPIGSFLSHFLDFLKITMWLIPLILFSGVNNLVSKLFASPINDLQNRRYFFLSSNKSITVIPFPSVLKEEESKYLSDWLEEVIEEENLVLDFSRLRHADQKGLGFILEIVKWAESLGKKLFIMGVNSDLRFLFKLQGIWEILRPLSCKNADDVLLRVTQGGKGPLNYLELYDSIYQKKNQVVLSFFGTLSFPTELPKTLEQLKPVLEHKSCIFDLTYCTGIDNLGIGFLLNVRDLQNKNGMPLFLTGLNSTLLHELKIAKVKNLFNII